MSDRGFEIDNDLPPGVSLNVPAFKGSKVFASWNSYLTLFFRLLIKEHEEWLIVNVKFDQVFVKVGSYNLFLTPIIFIIIQLYNR